MPMQVGPTVNHELFSEFCGKMCVCKNKGEMTGVWKRHRKRTSATNATPVSDRNHFLVRVG